MTTYLIPIPSISIESVFSIDLYPQIQGYGSLYKHIKTYSRKLNFLLYEIINDYHFIDNTYIIGMLLLYKIKLLTDK